MICRWCGTEIEKTLRYDKSVLYPGFISPPKDGTWRGEAGYLWCSTKKEWHWHEPKPISEDEVIAGLLVIEEALR